MFYSEGSFSLDLKTTLTLFFIIKTDGFNIITAKKRIREIKRSNFITFIT